MSLGLTILLLLAPSAPDDPETDALRQELWDQGYSSEEIERRLERREEERRRHAEFERLLDPLPAPIRAAVAAWERNRRNAGASPEENRRLLEPSLRRLLELRTSNGTFPPGALSRLVAGLDLPAEARRAWLRTHRQALERLIDDPDSLDEPIPDPDRVRGWIEQFAEERREREELPEEVEKELLTLRQRWNRLAADERRERIENLIRLLAPPPLEARLWRQAGR